MVNPQACGQKHEAAGRVVRKQKGECLFSTHLIISIQTGIPVHGMELPPFRGNLRTTALGTKDNSWQPQSS